MVSGAVAENRAVRPGYVTRRTMANRRGFWILWARRCVPVVGGATQLTQPVEVLLLVEAAGCGAERGVRGPGADRVREGQDVRYVCGVQGDGQSVYPISASCCHIRAPAASDAARTSARETAYFSSHNR